MNFLVAGEGGKDEDSSRRMSGEELGSGIDPADTGELKVHENDVGEVSGVSGESLFTRIDLSDDFDIGFKGE